jgi:hypothetical protein
MNGNYVGVIEAATTNLLKPFGTIYLTVAQGQPTIE